VENWGTSTVYVRLRLDEHMEIGPGAGSKGSGSQAIPLVPGSDIDDRKTWTPHILYDLSLPSTPSEFRHYWQWTMGGQKYYFPASASLRNEVYVDQKSPEDLGPNDVNAEGVRAKLTPLAVVVTMAEWKRMGSIIGPYWVYDTDGWAYWASPLLPGEATGLILDKVDLMNRPDDSYYYAINVVAQMATADGNDMSGNPDNYTNFKDVGGWTADGEALVVALTQASVTPMPQPSPLPPASEIVAGADGKSYLNMQDNTYREITADQQYGLIICAGPDLIPGTQDDLANIVTSNGVRYIGPTDDELFYSKGVDGLLGTNDDVLIGLCNAPIDAQIIPS
jgi:hypothetical protein